MIWEWDANKNRANLRDHGIEFETAVLVFEDPLMISVPDPHPFEERWRTMGLVGTAFIMVVHTTLEVDPVTGEERGRIITARALTSRERERYEEGLV